MTSFTPTLLRLRILPVNETKTNALRQLGRLTCLQPYDFGFQSLHGLIEESSSPGMRTRVVVVESEDLVRF